MKNFQSFFICDENNKLILARQFIPMTKQKLLEFSSIFFVNYSLNKQTNFFDFPKQNLRFLYLKENPKIFLVLVSNLASNNYLESFEVLKLLKKSIKDICKEENLQLTEEKIKANFLDLILSIDDITNNYARQETNYSNLIQSRNMESFNERDFKRELKIKEDKAIANIYKGIEEIETLKRNNLYVDTSVSKESIETDLRQKEEIEQVKNALGMKIKEQLLQRALLRRQEEMQLSKI